MLIYHLVQSFPCTQHLSVLLSLHTWPSQVLAFLYIYYVQDMATQLNGYKETLNPFPSLGGK